MADPTKSANLTEIGRRVRDLRKNKPVGVEELAPSLGFAAGQSIYDFEKGIQPLTDEQMEKLAELLGTTKRFLETGDIAFRRRPSAMDACEATRDPNLVYVPYLPKEAGAGPGIDDQLPLESIKDLAFRRQWLVEKVGGRPDGKVFVCKVAGSSMEPEIWDSDVILFDRSHRERADGRIFVLWTSKGRKVKRLQERADGWWAVSQNPTAQDGADFRLGDQDLIEGVVLWRGGEAAVVVPRTDPTETVTGKVAQTRGKV